MSDQAALLAALLLCYFPILYLTWKSEDQIGEETEYPVEPGIFNCTFCGERLALVHDFGRVALAGGFLTPEQFKDEKRYPLRLCYCMKCHAVQIADRIPPDTMFREYFYFSSSNETIRRHFREYAADVVERFKPKTVIEVGCNDGVLLNPLRASGVRVIGVDPSTTVPKGIDIVNDYYTPELAKKLGKVDVVIANNVFAHIDDIHGATQAVVESMKDDGVFIMEAHYLGDMIDRLQYDWIYHEHIYYYSLKSLETHLKRYGLRVFHTKHVMTHGGSMRYYICKDSREESQNVAALRLYEEEVGLDRMETYMVFSKRIMQHRQELIESLDGTKIVGYGASGRANALIQYCGLNVHYIVDDAPAKHGYYTPGSHIPIYSREKLGQDKPDQVVAFAWTYLDEIRSKCDVPLVVPFPSVYRIGKQEAA